MQFQHGNPFNGGMISLPPADQWQVLHFRTCFKERVGIGSQGLRMARHDDCIARTLLYVEDNPANLELVEQLIARRADLRLLTAADGNLGIEFARVYLPEVILMDINLPGLSGIEAMKILRADPLTAHIPIIALSANAMPGDIEKGLEAGFFNYITKPIKVNQFMDALDVAIVFSQANPPATKDAEKIKPS